MRVREVFLLFTSDDKIVLAHIRENSRGNLSDIGFFCIVVIRFDVIVYINVKYFHYLTPIAHVFLI